MIGDNCDVAPNVTITTGTHEIDVDGERAAGKGYALLVIIEDGCWICTSATILGGTKIGRHSIVAAGAIVKGEFPPYSFIGGVPAKVIKSIKNNSSIDIEQKGFDL